MDIYFNYCSDPYTGESATLVKCTRDTFEKGFMKAVELNKIKCMSSLGVYDSPQDVKESLLSDIRFYWGEIDKLNDYEDKLGLNKKLKALDLIIKEIKDEKISKSIEEIFY